MDSVIQSLNSWGLGLYCMHSGDPNLHVLFIIFLSRMQKRRETRRSRQNMMNQRLQKLLQYHRTMMVFHS